MKSNIKSQANTVDHNNLHINPFLIESSNELLTHLPPGQNYRHFADDIFRCIFVNENFCILIEISLKCVTDGPIDNNPALV